MKPDPAVNGKRRLRMLLVIKAVWCMYFFVSCVQKPYYTKTWCKPVHISDVCYSWPLFAGLGPLLAALGSFGRSWGTLGVLGSLLGRSGALLGRSWGALGRSWGALGALLARHAKIVQKIAENEFQRTPSRPKSPKKRQ